MIRLVSMLFLLAAFTLAARLLPWFQTWKGFVARGGSAMQVLFGDSRRMFANHVYEKADVYFHGGYYPSIYDNRESFACNHLESAEDEAGRGHVSEPGDFLGPPRDWIDSFSRNFFPSEHVHLGDEEHDHAHGDHQEHDHHEHAAGIEKEILPWLRLSTELDPGQVESYVVAAYWLREKLGRAEEAEQFLREGLRENPHSVELRYELGRLAFDARKDAPRARRLWERALADWDRQEPAKPEPDVFLRRNLLSQLARLEESEGNPARAYEYLAMANELAPGLFTNRLARVAAQMGGHVADDLP